MASDLEFLLLSAKGRNTWQDLADDLGVCPSTVYAWRVGTWRCPDWALQKIEALAKQQEERGIALERDNEFKAAQLGRCYRCFETRYLVSVFRSERRYRVCTQCRDVLDLRVATQSKKLSTKSQEVCQV